MGKKRRIMIRPWGGRRSRDSVVGTATGDGLRAGRPRGRSSSPGRVKNFLHVVQTGPGARPASYTMGTGGPFSGGKAARA
jgi:hypothetical protein